MQKLIDPGIEPGTFSVGRTPIVSNFCERDVITTTPVDLLNNDTGIAE